MDGYSESMQEAAQNMILGRLYIAPPTTKYVGLLLHPVGADGRTDPLIDPPSGKTYDDPTVEVTGTNYVREAVTDSDWSSATSTGQRDFITTSQNINAIEFPESGSAWGDVYSFVVVEASAGFVDLYFGGNLDTHKIIQTDTIAVFAAGNLKLQTKNSTAYI